MPSIVMLPGHIHSGDEGFGPCQKVAPVRARSAQSSGSPSCLISILQKEVCPVAGGPHRPHTHVVLTLQGLGAARGCYMQSFSVISIAHSPAFHAYDHQYTVMGPQRSVSSSEVSSQHPVIVATFLPHTRAVRNREETFAFAKSPASLQALDRVCTRPHQHLMHKHVMKQCHT